MLNPSVDEKLKTFLKKMNTHNHKLNIVNRLNKTTMKIHLKQMVILQGNIIKNIQQTFNIVQPKPQEVNINPNKCKFLLCNKVKYITTLDITQIETKRIENIKKSIAMQTLLQN